MALCKSARYDRYSAVARNFANLSTEETAEEFRQLRESYLPETILAYINTLQNAGMVLSRDLLLESMDLSALIAAEGSDVLELFVKTGKMQELVEAFALAGKTLLILTSNKPSGGSKSKRLRSKGWTSELWSVKS
jgi:nuclear pore complex protein Nup107